MMPKLRGALLPFTLRNAARLPFYAKFWEGVDVEEISSIKGLCRLPSLSKEEYRRSLMFDGAAVLETDYITHTTGTTGEVTWRHRSASEAAVINKLFGLTAKRGDDQMVLAIRYDRHGMAMPLPGQTRSIPIGLSDNNELSQSVKMLTGTYRFAEGLLRPTILAGSGHDIAVLAQAYLESQTPSKANEIRVLHVLGYVDAGLYRFLHSTFNGAEVIEKYSLTEIFGGAAKRWPATSFVLDPYVVGEVVDEHGAPVPPGGVGELVLTELFPFVQMQPLIRYRTGDIVLLVNDEEDDFRFEWWGRRHECALARFNDVLTWVLGFRPVADWLSLQPLVARQLHRPGLTSVTSMDLAPPCVSVSSESGSLTLRIDVGVKINPWWAKDALRGLAQEFWAALRSMVTVPAEEVYIRLSFRHIYRPEEDYSATKDAPSLRLQPGLLSEPLPELL